MAIQRVSRLQKHILRLLMAEHHRTRGGTSMGHLELVKALAGDKSNISHSLRTLETRGWIVIGRSGNQTQADRAKDPTWHWFWGVGLVPCL